MTRPELGRALARCRKAAGLSQEAAAALPGIRTNQGHISRIERTGSAAIDTILDLVDAYQARLVLVAADGPLAEDELRGLELLLRRLEAMPGMPDQLAVRGLVRRLLSWDEAAAEEVG